MLNYINKFSIIKAQPEFSWKKEFEITQSTCSSNINKSFRGLIFYYLHRINVSYFNLYFFCNRSYRICTYEKRQLGPWSRSRNRVIALA